MTSQEIIQRDIEDIVQELKSQWNNLENKTILITGSNGLLASYLVDTVKYLNDFILKKPCKVIGLNRSLPKKNSRNYYLRKDENFKFIAHNVCKPLKITQKIHYIFHAAGDSTPSSFQERPLETVDVNVKGIRWLLDLARRRNIKSMVYFSSGAIYGNPAKNNTPIKEGYTGSISPLSPRACYAESKRLSETLCSIYNKKYNVPVKIARIFVIYGPGVTIHGKKVLSDFMRNTIENKTIKMRTEGSDIRTNCYISDATVAFWKLLFSDKNGEVFNVGTDKEKISIKQMALEIHKLCGIKKDPLHPKIKADEKIKSAPNKFYPNIEKIKNQLDFSPKIKLKEGLKRTIEWNRSIFKKDTHEK